MSSLELVRSHKQLIRMRSTSLTLALVRMRLRMRFLKTLRCWCSQLLMDSTFAYLLTVRQGPEKRIQFKVRTNSLALSPMLCKNYLDWRKSCRAIILLHLNATWLSFILTNSTTYFYHQIQLIKHASLRWGKIQSPVW